MDPTCRILADTILSKSICLVPRLLYNGFIYIYILNHHLNSTPSTAPKSYIRAC